MVRMKTILLFALLLSMNSCAQDIKFITAKPSEIRMFWKSRSGAPHKTFESVLQENSGLRFLMNGGMFSTTYAPVGLYIERGRRLKGISHYNNPNVNFGIQPQGIFYVTGTKAGIATPKAFRPNGVVYATQSAPMLVISGKMNPQLPKGRSLARNGVGLLKDGRVLLAVSVSGITFHDFAKWFIKQGCSDALFMDGSVSEYWEPGAQPYGRFGVMIGVTK